MNIWQTKRLKIIIIRTIKEQIVLIRPKQPMLLLAEPVRLELTMLPHRPDRVPRNLLPLKNLTTKTKEKDSLKVKIKISFLKVYSNSNRTKVSISIQLLCKWKISFNQEIWRILWVVKRLRLTIRPSQRLQNRHLEALRPVVEGQLRSQLELLNPNFQLWKR